jgi:hypothetical protein
MNATHPIPTPAPNPVAALLVDEPQAARMLGVSARKLFSLEKEGVVRCVRLGRSKRYAIRDLEAAIEKLRAK